MRKPSKTYVGPVAPCGTLSMSHFLLGVGIYKDENGVEWRYRTDGNLEQANLAKEPGWYWVESWDGDEAVILVKNSLDTPETLLACIPKENKPSEEWWRPVSTVKGVWIGKVERPEVEEC